MIEKLARRDGYLYRARDDRGKVIAAWRGPALSDQEVAEEARKRGVDESAAASPSRPKQATLDILPVTLSVGLTCHEPYLKWLPIAVKGLDRQSVPYDQKIAVFDGCACPEWLRERDDWTIIEGQWGSPVPARNAALAACYCTWFQGFDADNFAHDRMAEVYRHEAASSGQDVGFIYPSLQYVDEDLQPSRLYDPPGWSYWRLRRGNFVDNCALWNVAALRGVGGFIDNGGLDDWVMACRISEHGWIGRKSACPPVLMREHDEGRRSMVVARSAEKQVEVAAEVRSFGIVTLLAPERREAQDRWLDWLNSADLPPHTNLHVVDNTGKATTRHWLDRGLHANRFGTITFTVVDGSPGEGWYGRHRHVAALYRSVLPHVRDDMVVTLEDDVEPPLGGLLKLHQAYRYHSQVGAVAGVYESPDHPGKACCAQGETEWTGVPNLGDIPAEAVPMPMLAGGFTLYAGWALREAHPIEVLERSSSPLGWDGNLSWRLRRRGWQTLIDGRVRCQHHTHGVVR